MARHLTAQSLVLIVLAAIAPLSVRAELVQGRDYELVRPPKPTSNANKVEVLEYFSYGCPHCFELYPLMNKWERQRGADVIVVRAPVAMGVEQWEPLARAYFAFDYSGDLPRLDPLIFQAIHEKHIRLFDDETIATWAEEQGLKKDKVTAMLKSLSVETKVKEADANARSIPIDGTPTIIVDGKYRLVGAEAKSFADWFPILDQLVAKARADKASVKKPQPHKS